MLLRFVSPNAKSSKHLRRTFARDVPTFSDEAMSETYLGHILSPLVRGVE